MNNLIWVYTEDISENKVIKKFYELNIEIIESKNEHNKYIYLITGNDYNKLKKYCVYKFKIYEFAGVKKIKNILLKYRLFILGVIAGFLIIILYSNVIVDVQIIHSKESIRELLNEELKEYGIKRLSFKKDFNEISKIKEKILNNNKDKLEWLEIESRGMKYIIRVEERLIVSESKKANYCNIVAKKDGNIISIQLEKGIQNVTRGSYVRKNDILISGDILLNEESVEQVCASGKISAEVWYNISVEMPLYYDVISKTGKKRINFMVEHDNKKSVILKSRLKDKVVSDKKLFSILGYNFYIQKEEEILREKLKYTEKEVVSEAIKQGLNKLNVSLNKDATIISQKVLKKNIKDSKIYLELFVSVKEDIGMIQAIN